MVLSAGEGQRLRPLSVIRAKPAMPLMGSPLIEYTMTLLSEAGVREIVVNLHHNSQSIVQALAEKEQSDEIVIHYSREPEILGTGGGVKQAAPLLGDETFLLLNGDTLVDVQLDRLIASHRSREGLATLLLRPKPAGTDYTDIRVSDQGRLLALGKRAASSPTLMFAGVWVLEPEALGRLPSGRFGQLEIDLLPALIAEGAAYGHVQDVPWFDVGTPERYLDTCGGMARGGIFRRLWRADVVDPPPGSPAGTLVVAGSGTTIHPEARFSGESILGKDCRIEGGARVHGAVLWDRVSVEEDALVRHSVVTDDVLLARASQTVGKVVVKLPADRARIRAGDVVGDCLVVPIRS
jgi:NDP-sugar pyrophosphorylase family protein